MVAPDPDKWRGSDSGSPPAHRRKKWNVAKKVKLSYNFFSSYSSVVYLVFTVEEKMRKDAAHTSSRENVLLTRSPAPQERVIVTSLL